MNNLLRIRTLTDKFFDGGTTPEEEQELYDFYRQDDIPEDLRPNQELFRDLAALATLAPTNRVGADPVPARNLEPHHRWWIVAAAAFAAVMIVGGGMIWRAGTETSSTRWDEDECVAYIYGQRVTDRDVVLNEMQNTMTAMTADGSDVVEEQLKAMFGNE